MWFFLMTLEMYYKLYALDICNKSHKDQSLTVNGLVIPYGDIGLGHHFLR